MVWQVPLLLVFAEDVLSLVLEEEAVLAELGMDTGWEEAGRRYDIIITTYIDIIPQHIKSCPLPLPPHRWCSAGGGRW